MVYSRPHTAELGRLGAQITELAAHLDAAEYRFLVLVEAFDRQGGWRQPGVNSCAHWLHWKCGLGIGVAREKVRVARALPELPRISGAFGAGRVSYSKVRAMTRVATPDNEEVLLNTALHGTAVHVETQVRLYRRWKRQEALQRENQRQAVRELSWHIDETGCWVFRGRFTPEQGALIAEALKHAMDAQFTELRDEPREVSEDIERDQLQGPAMSEPIAQRRADAMERVAAGYLARPEPASTGGDRCIVHLHTDIGTLRADGDGAEAEIENAPGRGSHVPAETSRRLACDAAVVHWRETSDGEPLSVGRKTRTIPPAIRRALKRRDGGCRFPGCSATRFVDAHHIHHWADGGETRLDNLVLLCRRHHRLLHEGGYGIDSRPTGEIRFSRPDGRVLAAGQGGRSRGNVKKLCAANDTNGCKIGPDTAVPRWNGESMDHDLALLALIQRE
jgi:hypothetical protein